ncbi:MAG: radical SAM protein [Candidatus Aenigmarchaeota archaeon]|nr:radical SAM protein [Candidatus Aenigmarchaeota archaeon]
MAKERKTTSGNLIKKTASLCPKCLKLLGADIFEKDGKVWIKKKCDRHGEFLDLYFGDYGLYKRFEKWAHDGKGISNPKIGKKNAVCPMDCGLCNMHKSHTALGNIVVTNRCDLRCFYCFFYAKAMGYVYEPSLDQIRQMLKSMKNTKPVGANAVQLTGGNPELREDLIDIIKIAKEEGYDHIQLNVNGTHKLHNDLGFAQAIKDAGVKTIYLSFDGTTPKTNPKNHYEVPGILDNCRKAEIGIVLVPTIVNTINDNDAGNILRFGIKNIDVVRGVNYQPVSLVGRITKADVKKFRITIPDLIARLEEQTGGEITKDDFYPVPTVAPITHFIEALTGNPKYELTTHFACGAATYIFIGDDGKLAALPKFVDVSGLMEYLNEKAEELKQARFKKLVLLKMLTKVGSFIDSSKQPKGLNLLKLLTGILRQRDHSALGMLHHRSLFVGMMHFMDLYNYDIERVKRCCVHYAQPDGRIVPFWI